eukprot:Gb_41218 [translate_table: standard]
MARSYRQERIMEMEKERERELFVRARDATQEAQRQGDEQLRAAMEASVFSRFHTRRQRPAILLCSFPLKFNVPSLEEAYWRKCSGNLDRDYVPVACLIVFCLLLPTANLSRHWGLNVLKEMQVHQSVNLWSSANLLWHTFAVILCCAVLVIQLGFSKWYQSNRGNVLLGFASVLWVWGSLKLFLISNLELRFSFVMVLIQCVFMSILYRVPFCIHILSRVIGLGLQIVAIMAKGSLSEAPVLFLFLFVGHAVGLLITYVFDRECRSSFLHALPQLRIDDVATSGLREQFYQSYRSPLVKEVPNLGQFSSSFSNPEVMDKQVLDEAMYRKAIQTNAPRRALGGFAGGFGGVSGLKSSKPPVIINTTSSANNISSQNEDLSTSLTDSWSDSLGALTSSSADNIVEGRLSTSIGSCSCIDSDVNLYQFHARTV